MIRILISGKNDFSEEVEQRLKNLCVAFSKEYLDHSDKASEHGVIICDGKQRFGSRSEIESWFQKLEEELTFQRSITSDACYMHPKTGDIC